MIKKIVPGRRRKKTQTPLESQEIKKASIAIKRASDQGVDKLNRVVKNIEKVEKKTRLVMTEKAKQVEKQNKKIDQTVKNINKETSQGARKLIRSANKIENISRRNLVVTLWVSVGVAILSMMLNIFLVVFRVG